MDQFFDRSHSFKNNLIKGDFERAKEKIDDNLHLVSQNLKELQEYLFRIGSKKENKSLIDKAYVSF